MATILALASVAAARRARSKDAADNFWSQATTAGHLTRLTYAGQEVRAIEAAAGAAHVVPVVGLCGERGEGSLAGLVAVRRWSILLRMRF